MKSTSRRSISIRGLTYTRLLRYCEAEGRSMSSMIEETVKRALDAEGVPEPTSVAAPKPTKTSGRRVAVRQHMEF